MAHRLLLCTSWFRPLLGRDMGTDLMDRLSRRGLEVVGVIGPDEEKLAQDALVRGLPYFTLPPEFRWTSATIRRRLVDDFGFAARLETWIEPIRRLDAELGVLYFATWIPPGLLAAPRRGWVNFHPAPLPELRGFLPEDFALLEGWSSMPGTLHVATDAIDEGPVILKSRPARLSPWDTPDSVMQKVGETARSCIHRGVTDYLEGRATLTDQKDVKGFYAGYQEFYPQSLVDWAADSHDKIHRRFQTFRGQHHRVDLKAPIGDQLWEVVTLELHRCGARGLPGDVLGTWEDQTLVRTTEGVAIVGGRPFVRDEGLPDHLDRREQTILPPGYRKNRYRVKDFARLIR
jgi:methionyl-tRNA formyltransferase